MRYYIPHTARPYPPSFRPPHGKQRQRIKGGRWMVRKTRPDDKRPWRAWTNGKSKWGNRMFKTQQGAIRWAVLVAWVSSWKNGEIKHMGVRLLMQAKKMGIGRDYA